MIEARQGRSRKRRGADITNDGHGWLLNRFLSPLLSHRGDDYGGGPAGCECAIHPDAEGKRVYLAELRDALTPDANVRHRPGGK